jgi:carboxylesterase
MSVKFSLSVNHASAAETNGTVSKGNGFFMQGNNGATIMLIHGLTGTPNEMRFLAKYLNKQGYSIACPRLANHGEPLGVLKKTTWQDCYQSVREAYLKIRESHSGPLYASGLSMGALLAILLAEEFSNEVAAISCLSPTLFYDGWNIPWYRCFWPLCYFTPLKHFLYFKEEPPYGIKNKALQQRVHKYYSAATLDDNTSAAEYGYPYYPVSLLYQLYLLVKHLKKILPSIHVPVQLIQAQNDDITSVKNSTIIYDGVSSKIKEMVLLNNSFHVITADQERATVAHRMNDFFTRFNHSY